MSPDAEVAVIGAGPYGLACTRFLKKAGVEVLPFGEKMRFWQERMPEQMILRSRRRSSHIADPDGSLSLDAFAAEHDHPRLDPVPLSEFESYGAWYGERAVPDLDGRRISAVVPRGERSFTLRLEDGAEPTVSRVIVAAGISPFAWRDSPLAELSDEVVSHSSFHRDFGRFRDRSVAVVGCGQSALESAALLHEEGAAVELIGPEISAGLVGWRRRFATSASSRGDGAADGCGGEGFRMVGGCARRDARVASRAAGMDHGALCRSSGRYLVAGTSTRRDHDDGSPDQVG